jgi:hypothetical protein
MANVLTIRVDASAAPAARQFSALDAAVDRFGTSALRAGEKFQAFATRASAALARVRAEVQKTNQVRGFGPATGGPIGPGLGERVGGALTGGFGRFGTFAAGAAGGAAYGALSGAAATAATSFQDQTRAAIALDAATARYNVTAGEQVAIVGRLQTQFGLTEAGAASLTAQATRLAGAIGQVGARESLIRNVSDALTANGRRLSELPEILRMAAAGSDEYLDRLGGVQYRGQLVGTPQQAYDIFKAQQGITRELTEQEKLAVRIETLFAAGAAAQGATANYLGTAAGKLEQLQSAYTDVLGSAAKLIAETEGFTLALVGARQVLIDIRNLMNDPGAGAERGGASQFGFDAGRASLFFQATPLGALLAAYGLLRQDGPPQVPGLKAPGGSGAASIAVPTGPAAPDAAAVKARFDREIRAQLDRQRSLEEINSRIRQMDSEFAGRSNPFARIFAEGEERMRSYSTQLGYISTKLDARIGRETSLAIIGQIGSAITDEGAINARRADLRERYRTVTARGFYGQPLTRTERYFGGESASERASRVFSEANELQRTVASGLSKKLFPDEAERATAADRERRRYLLSGLQGISPSAFSAAQRAEYDRELQRAALDSVEQRKEAADRLKSLDEEVKAFRRGFLGDTGDEAPKIDINVNLEDRAEDANFRIKNRTWQTGDTLTNQL